MKGNQFRLDAAMPLIKMKNKNWFIFVSSSKQYIECRQPVKLIDEARNCVTFLFNKRINVKCDIIFDFIKFRHGTDMIERNTWTLLNEKWKWDIQGFFLEWIQQQRHI